MLVNAEDGDKLKMQLEKWPRKLETLAGDDGLTLQATANVPTNASYGVGDTHP
jgi:hypothetical protein